MTQRGPASRSHRAQARSHRARSWTLARSLTALLALSTAAAWGLVPTPATHPRSAHPPAEKLRHSTAQAEPLASTHAARRTSAVLRKSPAAAPARSKEAPHARSASAHARHEARPEARPEARSEARSETNSRQNRRARSAALSSHHRTTRPEPRPEPRPEAIPLKRASLTRAPDRAPSRALPSPTLHPQPAKAGAPAAAGGELSADDFFRAAGASPEAAAQPEAKSQPATQSQPAAETSARPLEDTLETAADAIASPAQASSLVAQADPTVSPATADARVAALTHPSHVELAEEAAAPVLLPGLYRNGRLVVPAPLKGSHDILVHQNLMADDEGLERVRDNDALNRLRASHQLVPLAENATLRLNPALDADRRCARVWTVKFAADTARAFYARFHEPLQVNSAVRTIAFQVRLQRTNGNAAGIGGEAASPHLTGQAIDIGKRGMSVAEIAWMRAYLKPLMDLGKVDVEEEFQQACFHISVYKTYAPTPRHTPTDLAQIHRPVVGTEASR